MRRHPGATPSPRAVLIAALALAAAVWASRSDAADTGLRAATARAAAPADAGAAAAGVRGELARHLADQLATLAEARSAVQQKAAQAHAVRAQRARVAYRLLRERRRDGEEIIAHMRARAAVTWLLGRDRGEERMLEDELALLTAAAARVTAAAAQVEHVALPPRALRWPAAGEVARPFGRFVHERTRATLSRRGLDVEVAERAPAGAIAAGTVAYVGPVRGLDQGVLIDHGGYWSLVAKLGDVEVHAGQRLSASAPLGRAARRRLYLELRVKLLPGGIPIDPAPFFAGPAAP